MPDNVVCRACADASICIDVYIRQQHQKKTQHTSKTCKTNKQKQCIVFVCKLGIFITYQ